MVRSGRLIVHAPVQVEAEIDVAAEARAMRQAVHTAPRPDAAQLEEFAQARHRDRTAPFPVQ